ncbi:hypothetical protein BDW72DRAFT_91526 [Aspergillus terricola var. indicus]
MSLSSDIYASAPPRQAYMDRNICDYTIGWISTRVEGYIAATGVLDERHADNTVRKPPHHQPQYTYKHGRIRDHNIALNIPDVERATDVKTVVADMLRAFPFLRVILLVGAASAPSPKKDVRLGDVVVATKVIKPEEPLRISGTTGMTKSPSRVLSTGITELQTRIAEGLNLQQSVEHLIKNIYVADKRFRCPGQQPDRSLQIHYGPVVSVDQPVQNAGKRARLVGQHDALCLDTGSADAMAVCDCLPIRGIYNYADSQSFDEWRRYAELTAAVCAKEFLNSISEYVVSEMRLAARIDGLKLYIEDQLQQVWHRQKTAKSSESCGNLIDGIGSSLDMLNHRMQDLQRQEPGHELLTAAQARNDIKVVLDLQVNLRNALVELGNRVDTLESSNYVTQEQFEELKSKIAETTSRSDVLAEIAITSFDMAEDVLKVVEQTTGNRHIAETLTWMDLVRNHRQKLQNTFSSIWQRTRRPESAENGTGSATSSNNIFTRTRNGTRNLFQPRTNMQMNQAHAVANPGATTVSPQDTGSDYTTPSNPPEEDYFTLSDPETPLSSPDRQSNRTPNTFRREAWVRTAPSIATSDNDRGRGSGRNSSISPLADVGAFPTQQHERSRRIPSPTEQQRERMEGIKSLRLGGQQDNQ